MGKESIVQIGNHQYRYEYDPATQSMKYRGPVGSAPKISESEFLMLIASTTMDTLEQHGFRILDTSDPDFWKRDFRTFLSPKKIDKMGTKETPLFLTIYHETLLTNLILTKHREGMSITTMDADEMNVQFQLQIPSGYRYQPKYRIFDDHVVELLIKGDEKWWDHTRLSSLQREIGHIN